MALTALTNTRTLVWVWEYVCVYVCMGSGGGGDSCNVCVLEPAISCVYRQFAKVGAGS